MNEHLTIRAGIAGGAGYTGGELIRLLLHHPFARIHFVHSHSNADKKLYAVHTDLLGQTELVFTGDPNCFQQSDYDLLFLCVGHGEALLFLQKHPVPPSVKIIDLSQDFRMETPEHHFVYGLTEWSRNALRNAHYVSNPGCFATAVQLALLPMASAGLLPRRVNITGITGSTGAGQALSATSHFSWRSSNIQPYKTLSHQHLAEIYQTLGKWQQEVPQIHFIPWRGDFPRGIFLSAIMDCEAEPEQIVRLYKEAYGEADFVHISSIPIHMKQVVNTNNCVLHLEFAGGQLVVHTAIDNLLKGASGQAVQNMNVLFNIPEKTGLQLKALAF